MIQSKETIVKEYLKIKKNIRDNLLSERTGEQELQTNLSKFYRPITETQKATAREITEGLKPMKEGIENLPQAITFPPMQPLGEASGEASEEEESQYFGEIAKTYLNTPLPDRDTTFGIRKKEGLYYIGDKQATIADNNIIIGNEKFKGTPDLWELIMAKDLLGFNNEDYDNYARLMIKTNALHRDNNRKSLYPIGKTYLNTPLPDRDTTFGIHKKEGLYYIGDKQATIADNNIIIGDEKFKGTPDLWELIMAKDPLGFNNEDYNNYARLMIKTNALHRDNNPKSLYPKSSKSNTRELLRPIWYNRRKYEGEGVVIIPSDPNALLERLDVLLTSKEAGHTGVRNELVSICDELKRQGVLDTRSYKKLNSIIIK